LARCLRQVGGGRAPLVPEAAEARHPSRLCCSREQCLRIGPVPRPGHYASGPRNLHLV